jgi:outer membrane biosynthesis protein TonB
MVKAEEKRNNSIALILTLLIHAALLLIFIFTMAWRAPNPPIPEYGFELNFGTQETGSGTVQPQQTPGVENPRETTQQESQPEPEQPAQPQQTTTPVQQEDKPVDSKLESPVPVNEEKKEEPKKTEKQPEKPAEKSQVKTDNKPADKPAEKKDAPHDAATPAKGQPVNQGDKANTVGDQGKPTGTPDARALYGQSGGGGGGPQLQLEGWMWDEIPKPKVPNNESGRIVFKIWVSANGELERYVVEERGVSPEVEQACKEAIEKLTFSRKPGAIGSAQSEGRITFIIRAQ